MAENQHPITPNETWRLSRRADLQDAVGIIVGLPDHTRTKQGELIWGKRPFGGMSDSGAYDLFSRAMEQAVEDAVANLPNTPPLKRSRSSHLYETGPAAQTWPQIALMLWEHAKPYLENIDLVVSLGASVKIAVESVKRWHREQNDQILEKWRQNQPSPNSAPRMIEPSIVLTQGAAIALAVEDVVNRHGVAASLTVATFPRGFPGYSDARHPSWSTSYLVQCKVGKRCFMYHFQPGGELAEHYLMTNLEVTPLPFPPSERGQIDQFHSVFPGITLEITSE